MTGFQPSDANRAFQLLADRATEGISAEQADVLKELLAARPDIDADALDRVAAQIALTRVTHQAWSLPSRLRDKIRAGARPFLTREYRE